MKNKNDSIYVGPYGEILAKIAKTEMGIETLETRNSDSLDFHDLSAASVKAALEAAFIAGAQVGYGMAVPSSEE